MRTAFPVAGLRTAICIALGGLLVACARHPVTPVPRVAPTVEAVVPQVVETGEPYVGVELEDATNGPSRVAHVQAGPAAIAGLARGDRVVALGGAPVNARAFRDRVAASAPGDRLVLTIERSAGTEDVAVSVGRRADWLGPSAWPSVLAPTGFDADETATWYDEAFSRLSSLAPELQGLDDGLAGMFAALAEEDTGHNKLPATRAALAAPQRLLAGERRLMRELEAIGAGQAAPAPLWCELLAIACVEAVSADFAEAGSLAAIADAVAHADAAVARAFADVPGGRVALGSDLAYLVEQTAAGALIHAQSDGPRALRAMRASMHVAFPDLVAALTTLLAAAGHAPTVVAQETGEALPEGIASGEIRAWRQLGDGFIVAGGPGPNRYDMSRLLAVLDAGGDDTYTWPGAVVRAAQLIVDAGGNDRYEASRGGPGAGWLGVAVLIDHGGDDAYRTVFGGCGAGLFGFGVLIDAAGRDSYRCDAWSLGAGLYGGGLLIDAGDGDDVYASQILSQGVGGPRGAGLLFDAGGNDLYRANGFVQSAYGTRAVFLAFSQGIGYGLRPHDHGGVGALLDAAGDDRYEGGEFSQGGGYFWGLGLLRDAAGDDLYYGNRYSQGFAAHQAAGVLSDLQGDDLYWSMTAAAQGAAWDQSVALLHDAGGADRYRASQLSQGAAAHQSRAWLHDAGGDDAYWANDDRAQGVAGQNGYHFDAAAAIYSIGVLFDRDGRDVYSTGLADGELRTRLGAAADGDGRAGIAFDGEPGARVGAGAQRERR